MVNDQQILNSALMSIPSRSEKNEQAVLVDTFVEAGTLFKRLSTVDNQIIYGRRGTGKTHTLQYLASERSKMGEVATYTDLNSLGSAASVYSDSTLKIPTRATTLLRDLLLAIYEELRRTISQDAERLELQKCNQWLSEFLDQINLVQVIGETQTSEEQHERQKFGSKESTAVELTAESIKLGMTDEGTAEREDAVRTEVRKIGVETYHIKFGGVNSAMKSLASAIPSKRIWVLLDEWSSVPLDLQPYLADLLRRCLFNIPKLSVKIAALEYRSNFKMSGAKGSYIGIEIGAEVTSIINVDDYLVFENDQKKARNFYASLLGQHIRASGTLTAKMKAVSNEALINTIFTQKNAFDELVMAAEGVPRDAINIASLAAQQADDRKLSIPHVKRAARQWYLNVKRAAVDNSDLQTLLNWIVDQVIGDRKARAFLIAAGTKSAQIDALFDARVLHVTKRDISQPDGLLSPKRYDAYKLDYGCYVHLMATRVVAPIAEQDIEGNISVPSDDYRAVRRAVLDLTEYQRGTSQLEFDIS
jgi:hypothetical protein